MRDKIVNIYLNIKNWIIYNIFGKKTGKFNIPSFNLNYYDDFTKMTYDELDKKYIRKQSWGDYHPKDLQQWYDPKAVILNNGLNLIITENTKVVTSYMINGILMDNQPPVTIKHGVGLVTSKEAFGYGIYEWNIKLPIGIGLWPAVWLSCKDSWPPEIDVIEGYSNKKSNYGRNLNTDIHCGKNPETLNSKGAKRHGLFVNDKQVLNLKCYWTENYIKIYYNNFLCREITDKKDLAWFKNVKMLNIMNTALRREIMENESHNNVTFFPLIILDFRHYTI